MEKLTVVVKKKDFIVSLLAICTRFCWIVLSLYLLRGTIYKGHKRKRVLIQKYAVGLSNFNDEPEKICMIMQSLLSLYRAYSKNLNNVIPIFGGNFY